MVVKRIHSIEKHVGLSTATKPTDSTIGSEFYEYDTKRTYIVYEKTAGVANWTLKN